MTYNITVLPGDGIGPEVIAASIDVLEILGHVHDLSFTFTKAPIGGDAIDQTGEPLPKATLDLCLASDAVLLGAVGGPKWTTVRPEAGLLALRQGMKLFLNLRYAKLYPALIEASTLRTELISGGFDMLIVRELTGGIYFGETGRGDDQDGNFAYDVEKYYDYEVDRVARWAFELAKGRRGKVASIDKANVLESSRLWRERVNLMAQEYPEVELEHLYIDNATMQLIRRPKSFDILLCSNLFGDIISDEAAEITGSIGLLPSASLGTEGRPGLFEPVHGSAPDIAGKDLANPLATILSAAQMLRLGLREEDAAQTLEDAVERFLDEGHRTFDLAGEGEDYLACSEVSDILSRYILEGSDK